MACYSDVAGVPESDARSANIPALRQCFAFCALSMIKFYGFSHKKDFRG
ncbi:MAG TPA: hypothetical protein VHP54_03620 [Caproiciproducens sp.]|nr:hypothetical protein [Caproiciproducens sp.]